MLDLILAAVFNATIPFNYVDNRIVVDATVNGRSGYSLIVDTGSTGLVLTPQAAESLRLASSPAERVTGAGAGSSASRLSHVRDLRVGDYDAGAQAALVINLDRIRKAFHFPSLDGIIGYDALGGRYVGIDPEAQTLTVSSSPLPTPDERA